MLLIRVRPKEGANTASFLPVLQTLVNNYKDLFWASNGEINPRMGDILGKLVLVAGWIPNGNSDYFGKITPDISKLFIAVENTESPDLHYMSDNWALYNHCLNVQQRLHNIIFNGNRLKLKMTHIGGYGPWVYPFFAASGHIFPQTGASRLATGLVDNWTIHSDTWPQFPRLDCFLGLCSVYFEGVNYLTFTWLNSNGFDAGPLGVILIDFPGPALIEKIINWNFDHPSPPPPPPPAFTAFVSGRILDGAVPGGAGLAGVVVEGRGAGSIWTTTDANGRYSLTLNPGDSIIPPSNSGYSFFPGQQYVAKAGVITDLDFTAARSSSSGWQHPTGAYMVGGDLFVYGTSNDDYIFVGLDQSGRIGVHVTYIDDTADWPFIEADYGPFIVGGRIVVYGLAGNDEIQISSAVSNATFLYGGNGDDTFIGGNGVNYMFGETGHNFRVASTGLDIFDQGTGYGGAVFYGTPGDDDISVHWFPIESGTNLAAITHIPFPTHRDGLRVIINGVAHDMEYTPHGDQDTVIIYGGAGNDRIVMADDAAGQHWNAEFYGEEGNDTLIGARNLSDKRRGNDRLYGGPGDDILIGNSGNDLLDGGPGHDIINSGSGVNHVITDGLDDLTINSHDTVEVVATYPRARTAMINWGDGTFGAAQVELGTGTVTGSHQNQLSSAGKVKITVATTDATGTTATNVIPATVTSLLLNEAPGALSVAASFAGGLHVSFPGVPGDTYMVQATEKLSNPNWQLVALLVCDLDGAVQFDLPGGAAKTTQFFRAIAQMDLPNPVAGE